MRMIQKRQAPWRREQRRREQRCTVEEQRGAICQVLERSNGWRRLAGITARRIVACAPRLLLAAAAGLDLAVADI